MSLQSIRSDYQRPACPRCGYPYFAMNVPCGSCGFKCEGCFITSAVCADVGLPDDCRELTTLRGFRDSFMMVTDERVARVQEYYRIAPGIVERINRSLDRQSIYNYLRSTFILPAVAAVEAGENKHAETIYTSMMDWIKLRID